MRRSLLLAGLALILAGAGWLAWTFVPAPEVEKILQVGGAPQMTDQVPGLAWETRTVRITAPLSLRVGEVARLRLEAAPGEPVRGAAAPDAEDALFAEAYPDLAGVSYAPAGSLSLAWDSQKPLEFSWQLRGDQPGVYNGRLWFSLRLVPQDGSPDLHVPLLAVPLEVEVWALLGMDLAAQRWAGALIVLAGLGLLGWRGRF